MAIWFFGGRQPTLVGRTLFSPVTGTTSPTNVEKGTKAPGIKEIPLAHEGAVYALEFGPNGDLLFSAGHDGAARAWDLSSGKSPGEIHDSKNDIMIDIAALPNSPRIVAASYSGRVYVWNWKDWRIERTFDQALRRVESVAPVNGTKMALSGVDDAIYLWDASSGSVVAKLPNKHVGGIRALAADPNGRYLVAGDYQGSLSMWDLTTKTQIASLSIGPESISVWSLDWAPDGSLVAIGGVINGSEGNSASGLLVLYDPIHRKVVQRISGHNRRVNAVRFSRDGRLLYSAADGLRIWTLPEGELQQHLLSGNELFGLAESSDGGFIAAGNSNGTIHLVQTGDSLEQDAPPSTR